MLKSPVLVNSYFNPSRGGRAPGDVRSAFLEALESYVHCWEESEPEPVIEVRGQEHSISEVCGLLWNCTDFLPRGAREDFSYIDHDLRPGSTYAQAARLLKASTANT